MLKCRLDGLPPREFVVSSKEVVDGKESKASLQRKRAAQLQTLEPRALADAESLAAKAEEAGKRLQGPDHEKLLKKLRAVAETKRKNLMKDALPVGSEADKDTAKKYEAAVAKEASLQAELSELKKIGFKLDLLHRNPLEASKTIVIVQDASAAINFRGLAIEHESWKGDTPQLERLLKKEHVIWWVEDESGFVLPQTDDDVCAMLLASRLLGGYVASGAWLEASKQLGKILPPALRLSAALRSERNWEMYLHKSAAE
ncbi:unnamed protein product, partial [Symbiodinium sp. CCMP2456]